MEQQSTLEQRQRESVVAATTTDVVDRTFTAPAATVITLPGPRGVPYTIQVPAMQQADRSATTTAGETSHSEASGRWTWKQKLPIALAIVGWGFGLILLAVGCWLFVMLLRRSAALRSAWRLGDDYMARMVQQIKGRAAASTDEKITREMLGLAADAERDRAEFNRD